MSKTDRMRKRADILLLEASRHERLAELSGEETIARGHLETAEALRLAVKVLDQVHPGA